MLQYVLEFLRTLTNPEKLIELLSTVLGGPAGYAMLCAIVFSETGLLMGFFLPGDSLLFTVGVVCGAGQLDLLTVNILLMLAAMIGNGTGYYLGYRTGPAIFRRPDSRFFKQEYLERTKAFYEKHGGKTIVYAQFIPILRTFAPFVAGVGRMRYLRFVSFNVFGAIGWISSMTVSGYLLGNVPLVRAHFEKVVVAIVLISVTPLVLQILRNRKAS
ncbi:MAG: VTT domain-containing protein [Candidatus Solibacter usitatus]|nr:VTT domain-containing protein [Candidatus Solibacter usitatus]